MKSIRDWYNEDGEPLSVVEMKTYLEEQIETAKRAVSRTIPSYMRPARMVYAGGRVVVDCEAYGALVAANGEVWTLDISEVPEAVLEAFRKEAEEEAGS